MKFLITYQKNNILHKKTVDNLLELPDNVIEIKQLSKIKLKSFSVNYSKNLYNFFYELNTILQANLTLIDAILILEKNNYDKRIEEIIKVFHYSLKNGQYIHKNLKDIKPSIDKIIIEFIKVGELNGNIKESINSISNILEQTTKNKNKIIKSFSYPIVITISLFISTFAIFKFIIPKFQSIYQRYEDSLPMSTQYLLNLKSFLDNYFILLLTFIVLTIYISKILYKKSSIFKGKLDKFLVTKIPLLSHMLLVSNSSNFFFCLSTLLKDKHQFYESLKNSKTLISNHYLQKKISEIESDIKEGMGISKAFEKSKLFDDLTIRLINTGEKSNNLPLTISKIDTIYKEKLDKTLQGFITVFEPTIIAIMATLILWLVLAIFTPIWDMGTILK